MLVAGITCLVGNKIKVSKGRVWKVIDRGQEQALRHGLDTQRRLDGRRGPQAVSHLRLIGSDGDPADSLAEDLAQTFHFSCIAGWS